MRGYSRRSFLKLGVVGSIGLLAGCSSPFSTEFPLSVDIYNSDSSEHRLNIEIWKEEENGLVSSSTVDIQSGTDSNAAHQQVEETIDRVPHLLRVQLDNGPAAHFHFVPSCTDSENVNDGIRIRIQRQDGRATLFFDQNTCS